MPHICLRCKTRLEASPGLAPRCPACGGTKFSFESARKEEVVRSEAQIKAPVEESAAMRSGAEREITEKNHEKPQEPMTPDSVESIRIIEPGKYNLNLLKLAESDDRVIQVGKDGNYRLDLHSMMGTKKKR